MDGELARWVVIAITTVGALTWLAALTVLLHAARAQRATATEAAQRFEIEGATAPPGTLIGLAEVEGEPDELSSRLAAALARETFGPFGPIKVVSRDAHEVVFESTSGGAANNGFRRARVWLRPLGHQRTRVEYAIETNQRGRILLGFGWAFLALGLAGLIVGPWLAMTYCLPSPNPGVRSQAVQMVQIIHLLWPPFLFAALSRQPTRMFRARMESLVGNLPYAG